MNLTLDIYEINEHAEVYMRRLGITYQIATPQSLYDCWWFWNCQNVPTPLPKGLREFKTPPHDVIGNGLSKEEADAIKAWKP